MNNTMWICPKCNESIEDQFDCCWKCAGQSQPAATQDKLGSPIWSALSLASPICYFFIALLATAGHHPHPGNGNMDFFPQGFTFCVLSFLFFNIAGIVFGVMGLASGRWPIVALLGLFLNGLIWLM